jgi:GrpB-like predicted nucleotidyltransferase (UPF0157 family)
MSDRDEREREDEVRRATVGDLVPHDAPVHLAPYDPAWPARYAVQADAIRAALGGGVLLLEHVGSTSVPGLLAKPIIDILLVVADPAAEAAYVPALERAGYVLRIREPDWYQHRMLKRADPAVNLHVFGPGSRTEIDRMIRFRDRLRDDPADRERYARAKTTLAARTWRHLQFYADAKTAVIEDVLRAAEAASPDGS